MRRLIHHVTLMALLGLVLIPGRSGADFTPSGLVVFLTDFGTRDDAVAVCKGVMLGIDRDLTIVDLTHDVTAFDVREGAFYLAGAAEVYPEGTVFVGVVDPGVGTARRAVVVETTRGHAYVVPDNGLLTVVLATDEVAGAWHITDPRFMRPEPSTTFHGRDVFSPAGAVVAAGRHALSGAGPPAGELVRLDITVARQDGSRIEGEIQLLDKSFGNLWTNIPRPLLLEAFDGSPDSVRVALGAMPPFSVPLVATFGDVGPGRALAYFNSRDRLSLALNQGNLADSLGVSPGVRVIVSPTR
jgi:S-adenosylmethionine hydrolase